MFMIPFGTACLPNCRYSLRYRNDSCRTTRINAPALIGTAHPSGNAMPPILAKAYVIPFDAWEEPGIVHQADTNSRNLIFCRLFMTFFLNSFRIIPIIKQVFRRGLLKKIIKIRLLS